MQHKYASVHGRFQPLHLGHLNDYILPVSKLCEHLIIGIANPDPTLTLPDDANYSRAMLYNNPLTYFERLKMIEATLIDAGLKREEFTIVPFPINYPQLIKYYVPEKTVHYLTIFDDWGKRKLNLLKQNNFNAQVLYEKKLSEKLISATQVRENIIRDIEINELLPKKISNYLMKINIKNRLIALLNKEE